MRNRVILRVRGGFLKGRQEPAVASTLLAHDRSPLSSQRAIRIDSAPRRLDFSRVALFAHLPMRLVALPAATVPIQVFQCQDSLTLLRAWRIIIRTVRTHRFVGGRGFLGLHDSASRDPSAAHAEGARHAATCRATAAWFEAGRTGPRGLGIAPDGHCRRSGPRRVFAKPGRNDERAGARLCAPERSGASPPQGFDENRARTADPACPARTCFPVDCTG